MTQEMTVWVFNGAGRHPSFPSAVFFDLAPAEEWIRRHALSGMLTRYPVNVAVYEWAIAKGVFKPKKPEHMTPEFIARFSDAHQEHYHYEHGERR